MKTVEERVKAHDKLAESYKKVAEEAEKTAEQERQAVTDMGNSVINLATNLDALEGRDKTLSDVVRETGKIAIGFEKWDQQARKVAETLEASGNPKVKELAEYVQQLRVEAEQLQPQMIAAFQAKQVEEFNKSLKDTKKEFENLTEYETILQGIHDKFETLREDAEKRLKGTEAYGKALEDINKAEIAAIKNSNELAMAGDNLWDGFAAGARKAKLEVDTLGKVGAKVFDSLSDAISDSLVDGVTKGGKGIDDIWKNLMNNLYSIFLNMLAKKIVAALVSAFADSEIGSGISSLLSGAVSLGSSASSASSASSSGSSSGSSALGTTASVGSAGTTGYTWLGGSSAAGTAGTTSAAEVGATTYATESGAVYSGTLYSGGSTAAGSGTAAGSAAASGIGGGSAISGLAKAGLQNAGMNSLSSILNKPKKQGEMEDPMSQFGNQGNGFQNQDTMNPQSPSTMQVGGQAGGSAVQRMRSDMDLAQSAMRQKGFYSGRNVGGF